MYFQKNKSRYSFVYYDLDRKKNIRLSRADTPPIDSDEQAQQFCETYTQKVNGAGHALKERLKWKLLHPHLIDFLEKYEETRKEDAPNTSDLDRIHLSYYIFPFFLMTKKFLHFEEWPKAFEEFRNYLQTVKPLKRKKGQETLAYATKNHIIKSLNMLMVTLHRWQMVSTLYRCRGFHSRFLNEKDETSVLSLRDQVSIYEELGKRNALAASMFSVSLHSGLRLNELLGLSLADFFEGTPPSDAFRSLWPETMPIFGYLCLESQPASLPIRQEDGQVLRKPLKGKKKISNENSRIIPITDVKAFSLLAQVWNHQRLLFQKKTYGADLGNYLLFNGLTKNTYSSHLRDSQKSLGLRKRFTPHDTRHTYSTWLVERTAGNFSLCRIVLGHQKLEMTFKYVHMNARIKNSIKMHTQLQRPLLSSMELPLTLRENSKIHPISKPTVLNFVKKPRIDREFSL